MRRSSFLSCLAAAVLWSAAGGTAPGAAQGAHLSAAEAAECAASATLTRPDGLALDVTLLCRASQPVTFRPADERSTRFVSGLAVRAIADGTEARYRFDLTGFAAAIDSTSLAVVRGASVLVGLGGWLLEPGGYDRPPTIDIRVEAASGLAFAAGLPQVGDAWRLAGTTVGMAGFSAFGRLAVHDLPVPALGSLRPGATRVESLLRVAILDGMAPGMRADVLDWVRRTAEAQAHYWQGFPAREALLVVVPMVGRRGVGFGRAEGGGGVSVMVEVGADADRRRLFDDWVLVHELVHTGMPYVRGHGGWLMEGAATYVEPIVRARAGWKSEADVWQEWLDNMPLGVTAFGRGLASTAGRERYWAGALFMLQADLAIRAGSEGAKGLEDCLRGVLWSGLDATRWTSVAGFAAACDRAVGGNAMRTLIARHYERAEPIDLAALWREIGVTRVDGRIVLDDVAPAARWRRLIVPGLGPQRTVKLPWQS